MLRQGAIYWAKSLRSFGRTGIWVFALAGGMLGALGGAGNAHSDAVTATIPVGALPTLLSITPDGSRVYVANQGDRTISVISTATNTVLATIPLGPPPPPPGPGAPSGPTEVALTPDGSRGYATTLPDNAVWVIDTATNTVTAGPITVGQSPVGIAVHPTAPRAYVANLGAGTVSIIDTTTNLVIGAPIAVPPSPTLIAFTPDGTHAYVTHEFSNTVSVIDTITNLVVNTITMGPGPTGVAVTPDGLFVYVTTQGTFPPPSTNGEVVVISTSTNMIVATPIPIGPPGYGGVAVTPQGDRVYVAEIGGNTLKVIDRSTNTVIDTITVGNGPRGVAVLANDGRVYVANGGSNTVSVVTITPGTPGQPLVVAGDGQVTVTVTPPTTGGKPTSYTVQASPGGASCTVPLNSTSCTITGLTNGTGYTFTITATNAGGTSGSSVPSEPVTPTQPVDPNPPPQPGPAVTPPQPNPASVANTLDSPTPTGKLAEAGSAPIPLIGFPLLLAGTVTLLLARYGGEQRQSPKHTAQRN